MVVNTTKETVCVNQIIGQKLENIVVEGDMIVPDIKPDILNTITNSGTVCIYKKEVLDGKIRIDGSLNVYIVYLADDENGNVRSLNTSLDFTNIIEFDSCKEGLTLDETISIKSIECRVLNGRKVGIKAVLDANLKLYSNENVEVITQVDDMPELQVLEDSMEINSLIGNGSTKVFAKDTITLDNIDDLAEILKVDLKLVNKENKISYNKVLAKADAELKIMYLTEDNRINTVVNTIPVMGFIDMPNVTEEHICNTKYKLKNLLIKPNSVEEHSIYVETEIEIVSFVYEKKNVRIIKDLYSPVEMVQFKKQDIETRCYKNHLKDVFVLRERIPVEDLNEDKILDVQIGIDVTSSKVSNGSIYYDCEAEIEYTFESKTSSRLSVKSVRVPFNYSMELPNLDATIVETNVEVQDTSAIVLPDGNIETRANIDFGIESYKDEKINVINEIEIVDGEVPTTYSIVIYYTKRGDTLWNIAKRFNSTVAEIVKVNGIENPDKIDVGVQLFIPKHVNINVPA